MADINDRLDRLQRREEFDRNGLPLRPDPVVARPAGVDDRLGEVLDAVAAVVARHPGLSVMVAVADGRAGRPVVRVTERDGSVETGVVVVGAGAPTPADQAAVVPSTERPRETVPPEVAYGPSYEPVYETRPEPAYGSRPSPDPRPEPAYGSRPSPDARPEPVHRGRPEPDYGGRPEYDGRPEPEYGRPAPDGRPESTYGSRPEPGPAYDHRPEYDDRPNYEGDHEGRAEPARPYPDVDGRHSAPAGRSWHDSLWSAGAQARFRAAEDTVDAVAEDTDDTDDQPPPPPAPPGGTIPLPQDTSQVVTRLAQLLRDNPTLASSWSREAPE